MTPSAQSAFFFAPERAPNKTPFDVCARKHGGNERSKAANLRALPEKGSLRERVRVYIGGCEQRGATCAEIAERFGRAMHSISGRISELKEAGKVFDSGRTRNGGTVLVGRRQWCNGSEK